MAHKPETLLSKKVLTFLRSNYPGFYFKSHGGPYQVAGLPDIIGCHRGRYIGIELKVPGHEDELKPIQQKRIDQINQAGGIAFMATSCQQIDEILKEELK